ncbi:methyltransferase [Paenibacillus sp. GD4]|uniref:class I SAM-dependent methyltransferase n=1 Tax=Paenibacillus sp. GD4 TaxID=3068890 RepID=UPI002796944E|nr:methyltransferase [Paenibacillus sp. GD4]MDQ1913197.1 methyltransferase [Paenibacillus sp. GD4]
MSLHSTLTSRLSDKVMFFQKFLRSPRDVGSLIPSSTALTEKMLEPVDWANVRAMAELGAGTGVFTRAIHVRKHPECKVLVCEKDAGMRSQLREKYDGLYFYHDAQKMLQGLSRYGMDRLDCVVSGLPFANFPAEMRERIISQVKQSLTEDGVFIAFQYSLQMKRLLTSCFDEVSIGFVPWNIPPAFVYVCRQKKAIR